METSTEAVLRAIIKAAHLSDPTGRFRSFLSQELRLIFEEMSGGGMPAEAEDVRRVAEFVDGLMPNSN